MAQSVGLFGGVADDKESNAIPRKFFVFMVMINSNKIDKQLQKGNFYPQNP